MPFASSKLAALVLTATAVAAQLAARTEPHGLEPTGKSPNPTARPDLRKAKRAPNPDQSYGPSKFSSSDVVAGITFGDLCGYDFADPKLPFGCVVGYQCGINTINSVVGCCGYPVTDCPIPTTCVSYAGPYSSESVAAESTDPLTLFCPSTQPNCVTNLYPNGYSFLQCFQTDAYTTIPAFVPSYVSDHSSSSSFSQTNGFSRPPVVTPVTNTVTKLVTATGNQGGNTSSQVGGGGGGGDSTPVGAIVGGVIGGVALIAIIIFLIWFFLFRKKKKSKKEKTTNNYNNTTTYASGPETSQYPPQGPPGQYPQYPQGQYQQYSQSPPMQSQYSGSQMNQSSPSPNMGAAGFYDPRMSQYSSSTSPTVVSGYAPPPQPSTAPVPEELPAQQQSHWFQNTPGQTPTQADSYAYPAAAGVGLPPFASTEQTKHDVPELGATEATTPTGGTEVSELPDRRH